MSLKIGLEIHASLLTKTKLFCSCQAYGAKEPNTQTCPVCLGHPGSKPVLNKKALDYALKLCLALHCEISQEAIFSRKSYFYPDLAKNYQITQYEIPLGKNGNIQVSKNKIKIRRVHLEEDPGALVHVGGKSKASISLVDYNRSGLPLCEIVTEPVITSASEAREVVKQLTSILEYLEIFDIKICELKADVNCSIEQSGYTRVEIKNITGFKEIEQAVIYEIKRQENLVKKGGRIIQETRGWDSEKKETYTLRTKETEEDYGYITDTDLVPQEITKETIETLRRELPELPQQKAEKYAKKYSIDKIDAEIIAQDKHVAELFEKIIKKIDPKLTAKWFRHELLRVINLTEKTIHELNLKEEHILEILSLIKEETITEKTAKEIVENLVKKPFSPKQYIKEKGLEMKKNIYELENLCKEAVKENQNAVKDYLAGEEKSINFIIGKVMGKTKGTAKPQELKEIIKNIIHDENTQ
ncbi:Asp-tRNA(Asn)/Glu-tRNA(Gln) amidotransferase subunit GatB [Candidatus Woesearchaeota archaeon]|nr:Asp-tRNA(Asn)/Glu-tRNA(Gln) amidotransferase subunit GatB [Candidatus Woesearchaeota archaeon]